MSFPPISASPYRASPVTKADVEEKIKSGKCLHKIRTLGNPSGGQYVTKYVVDLKVLPEITEIRIYADDNGRFHIPSEYRSDVIYGADVKALAVILYYFLEGKSLFLCALFSFQGTYMHLCQTLFSSGSTLSVTFCQLRLVFEQSLLPDIYLLPWFKLLIH